MVGKPVTLAQMRGFTLVELMVTIVILAIITMVGLNLGAGIISGGNGAAWTERVRFAAIQARQDAIQTGVPVSMTLSGCKYSFAYLYPSIDLAALPVSAVQPNSGITCTSNSTSIWTPIGFLVSPTTSVITGTTMSINNGYGTATVFFHGGGAIRVQ